MANPKDHAITDHVRHLDNDDREVVDAALAGLVAFLGDDERLIRHRAYKTLSKLDKKAVARHAGAILHWVVEDNPDIRLPAFQLTVMLCLSPAQLAPHARIIIDRLLEDNNDVQLRACKLLTKLKFSPESLEPHAGLIASQMGDDHPEVRLYAYHFLVPIKSEALAEFTSDIAKWLSVYSKNGLHEESETRLRACRLLLKLNPKELGPYADMILQRYQHDSAEVSLQAFHLLKKMRRESLAQHVPVFVQQLSEDSADMRLNAFHLLMKVSPDALAPHAKVIMQQLSDESIDKRWQAYRLTYKALSSTDLVLPALLEYRVAGAKA